MKGRRAGTILVLGSVGYLLAIAFASLHPSPAGWGLHLAGFLPSISPLPVAALLLPVAILGIQAGQTLDPGMGQRYAEAVAQYRTAIRLDGEREVYRRSLDFALEAAGDTTSARSP